MMSSISNLNLTLETKSKLSLGVMLSKLSIKLRVSKFETNFGQVQIPDLNGVKRIKNASVISFKNVRQTGGLSFFLSLF